MKPFAPVKTVLPRGAGLFPRTRLFQWLDDARATDLIWVTGAPGAGKTSLLASYIKVRGLDALWYRLDKSDHDPATFFFHLTLGARKSDILPRFAPAHAADADAFAKRYFRELCDRLEHPLFLVLDDCHALADDALVYRMLLSAFPELPAGSNLIFLSRNPPPRVFARPRANRMLRVLDPAKMDLDSEEIHGLGNMLSPSPLDAAALAWLEQQSGGWAAGLVLMLEHIRQHPLAVHDTELGALETVFNYLASEIFERATPALRAFLLQSSLFPSMTAAMAEALTGMTADDTLTYLQRQRLFIEVQQCGTYKYHDLFRAFLRAQMPAHFAPDALAALQRRAAQILLQANRPDDAINVLLKARLWSDAARLLRGHAETLLRQGRHQTLRAMIEALPDAPREADPWLAYWLGLALQPYQIAESRRHLTRAFERFQNPADKTGCLLSWAGIVGTYLYEWGDFKALDACIDWLDRQQLSVFPDREVEVQVTFRMAGALTYRQPQHPAIGHWVSRAIALAHELRDPGQRLEVATQGLGYYLWMGDLAKAHVVVECFRGDDADDRAGILERLLWKTMLSYYRYLNADFAQVCRLMEEGLTLADAAGIHVFDYIMYGEGVYGHMWMGQTEHAEALLDRFGAVLSQAPHLNRSHYHFLRAWTALQRERLPVAREHAERALNIAREVGAPYPEAVCCLGMSELLQAQHEDRGALAHLRRAYRISRRIRSRHLEFICRLHFAHLGFKYDRPRATGQLALALRLGREQGYFGLYWFRPRILAQLCAQALDAGMETDYVRQLVSRLRLAPTLFASSCESWPWPVKIYSLGHFRLFRNDAPLPQGGKTQRKPLEMLKLLLATDRGEMNPDRIVDLLWPDAEGDCGRQTLYTTLHRLRKLLGCEEAVLFQNGKLFLNPYCCWTDKGALERALATARDCLQSFPVDEVRLAELTERLLHLYTGPFLQTDDDAWLLSSRQHLAHGLLAGLCALGKHWEKQARWPLMEAVYQKILDIDPLSEPAYQALMRCYQEQGRCTEMQVVYQRCRDTLHTLGGRPPSADTENLRHTCQNR